MTTEQRQEMFTEGPWYTVIASDGGTYICTSNTGEEVIAEVSDFGDNADLIAVAPELYKAAKAIARYLIPSASRGGFSSVHVSDDERDALIAALAKGRGEVQS